VFEVCIINQTKGVSEPDRVVELAVEWGGIDPLSRKVLS
jgi:hypothetical protein